MGTIADKLNYLNTTKLQIKTALTNKGVTVSDTDTFRSYSTKIDGIVVSKTQTKNVSITKNEAYTITPDSSYTGLDKVVVTPATQTKDVKLTTASATTITPDSGKVGLTSVKVTPQRQEKSISVTANQTYTATPDANYVGLSKVTVTPAVETKTTTITKNGSTTVSASSGKVGMTKVTITTNVPLLQISSVKSVYTLGEYGGWSGHKSATISGLPGRKCILIVDYGHSSGIAGFNFSNGTGADQHIVINGQTGTLIRSTNNVNYLGYYVLNTTATSVNLHYATQYRTRMTIVALW